jgi:hypothetical protein
VEASAETGFTKDECPFLKRVETFLSGDLSFYPFDEKSFSIHLDRKKLEEP